MKRVISSPLTVGRETPKVEFLGPKLADEIYQLCYTSYIFHGIEELQAHLVANGFEINNSLEKWELCDTLNLLLSQKKLVYNLAVNGTTGSITLLIQFT